MAEGKALVMGASGFVGSHVVKALAEEGRQVRIFTRASSDISGIDHLEFEHTIGELGDAGSLREAIQGCSSIYYCIVDTRAWLKDPAPLRVTNVEGLRKVMDVAMELGVERFVYCSTVLTLGLNPSGVASEKDAFNWWEDASEYARVRVEAENLLFEYCERGLPGMACNVSMTYGADDWEPTPHGWLVAMALRGMMPYWDASFSAVGIRDVADAMLLAEKHGRVGERYVITDRSLPLKTIWSVAKEAAGSPFPLVRFPMWAMYALTWTTEKLNWLLGMETVSTVTGLRLSLLIKDFDNSKARRELHWNPRPVEESIAEAARWFHRRGRKSTRRAKEALQRVASP